MQLTFQHVQGRIGSFWFCWTRSRELAGVEKCSKKGSIRSCRKRRDLTRSTSLNTLITPANLSEQRTSINGAACWWSAAMESFSKWWTGSSRDPIGRKLCANYHSVSYRAVPETAWQNPSLTPRSKFSHILLTQHTLRNCLRKIVHESVNTNEWFQCVIIAQLYFQLPSKTVLYLYFYYLTEYWLLIFFKRETYQSFSNNPFYFQLIYM